MMASVVLGGGRRKSLTLRGVDPETCMIVFKNHWAQVVKILEKHEPGRSSSGALSFLSGHGGGGGSGSLRLGPIPADEASAVQNYVEHMLFLLMEEEAGQGGAMGPILEFVVLEGVMERLFLWSLRRQFTEDMKLEQLRMYQMLLAQARQPLLHHKPVLRPLMMLLASCAGAATDSGGVVEAELVLLLNQLCVALVKDPSVLELFFHTSEDQGAANFLLFSLLIPYTHRQGSVGQQARDALLLIMSLSASEPRVARHIADNTYFCPVLATGLSGLYSSLPARLQVYSEDWSCLDEADWQQVLINHSDDDAAVPSLVHFLHSLDFCSAVTKVAHPSIRTQLLGYIYNGFLVPVLAPALHKLTVEEVTTTTAYLDLFLRSVSSPTLLQTFLSFILLHAHDNVHVLDTLVSRVNTPFQLGTVSLALFRTLIGLFCEDVMLQLVFRYLIPRRHLSRRRSCSTPKQRDGCCSSGAASFLLLLPTWCPAYRRDAAAAAAARSEHIHWPDAAGPAAPDSVGYCRGSDFLMDANYLQYLQDARHAISTSHRACRLWSAPYDGSDPSPGEYRSDTPGYDDEDELLRRAKRDSVCSSATSPLPPAASPAPSSTDTVSTGNHGGRAGSALELEWDDIFADDDPSPPPSDGDGSGGGAAAEVDRCALSPAPPQHLQEMRRSAIKLVHGAYVEESEFQDDVMVYDLVAQRDTKAAMLERLAAANRRSRGSVPRAQRPAAAAGKTVLETVNGIMSTRRRSDDGGRDDGRRADGKIGSEGEALAKTAVVEGELARNGDGGRPCAPSCDFTVCNNHVNATRRRHAHHDTQRPAGASPNGRRRSDGFVAQYHELMLSLGAEPDCDDFGDDIGTFRRRVRALRQKLEEEGEELRAEFLSGASWDDGKDEEEDEEEDEEDEEEEEEEVRKGGRKHGVPFTGPFISVLLSRLENLLENSIAVNLLVTGILAQLASYPQPLLRSFLLCADAHSHPNVRTLYQVLVTVHAQIERYVAARPDYPALVTQAWRFLLAKDQDCKARECLDPALPSVGAVLPPCPPVPPPARSRVFAIVLFAEFLKELAAIAQEHSVALQ